MPSNCTAYKCSNTSDEGYALVRYPQDETLKQKWIAAVGRGKNWSPSSSQKLCEVHFKSSEVEFVAGRKRIKLGSVPSRFCTCSSEDQENCHRKLKRKPKYRNGPYIRQALARKHNNDCCIMQPPIKNNKILCNKQDEVMEEIRRENDMLKAVILLLQEILQNRKQ